MSQVVSAEHLQIMKELEAEFWDKLLWGFPEGYVHPPPEPKRHWAWIEIAGKKMLTFIDPDSMKAYEKKDYECTDIEIPSFTFIRWARPMDL